MVCVSLQTVGCRIGPPRRAGSGAEPAAGWLNKCRGNGMQTWLTLETLFWYLNIAVILYAAFAVILLTGLWFWPKVR